MGSRAKGFYCYDMIAGRMSFTNPIRGIPICRTLLLEFLESFIKAPSFVQPLGLWVIENL